MQWRAQVANRTTIITLFVVLAWLLTACEVPAADIDAPQEDDVVSEEAAIEAAETEVQTEITDEEVLAKTLSVNAADMPAVRLSELISATVVGPTGDRIGQIDELIVDIETGEWTYVIVLPDEAADLGEALLPMPAIILSYEEALDDEALDDASADEDLADTLVVTSNSTAIAQAPRLVAPDDELPTADPLWYTTYYDYWSSFGYPAADTFYPNGVNTYPGSPMAVSELQGRPVFNPAGEELATIRDLIFDDGFANYATLDFHEHSLAGDITSIVPLYVLIYNIESEQFVLDQERGILTNMPRVDPETWPDLLIDPAWDAAIVEYWETLPLLPQTGARVIPATSLQASQLIGYEVLNAERETLGEIEDFAVDPQTNHILFAILSFDDLFDIGDEWFPVPLNELSLSRYYQEFALDVDQEWLEAAPSFTANDLSTAIADTELQLVLNEYWGTQPISVTEGTIPLSSLFDDAVVNAADEQLGEIDDAILDLFDARVDFYVLEFGGFLDLGDQEVAVPADRLTLWEDEALLDVDPAAIEDAPEFIEPLEPYVYDPQWETQIENYWETAAE